MPNMRCDMNSAPVCQKDGAVHPWNAPTSEEPGCGAGSMDGGTGCTGWMHRHATQFMRSQPNPMPNQVALETQLGIKPKALGWAEAGSLPKVALTSYKALAW